MPISQIKKKKQSVREQVGAKEWETRVNLAACYRLMHEFGMTEMIANHISARVPGTRDEFLINPYGMLYEEMTASINNMFRLERACQLQVMTLSCNVEIQLPPNEVVKQTQDGFKPGARRRWGLLEWPALLRKLDKADPSYRD